MVEFLQNYWWVIVLLVSFGAYFAWYYKKYGKEATLEEFRELTYKLMLAAEKHLEDNDEKFQWVLEHLYEFLPEYLKDLFSPEDLEIWVQKLYDDFKDLMDDGVINNSVEEVKEE